MKTSFLNTSLMAITLSLMLSCSSDSEDSPQEISAAQIVEIEANVESGNWRISSYIDSGKDETSDFAGYVFTFNSDGSITATNGVTEISGTWSVTRDDDDDDDDRSDVDFNIFFQVPESSDFDELNEDWDIVSASATRIELIDVSGGNGGTDNLVFVKN